MYKNYQKIDLYSNYIKSFNIQSTSLKIKDDWRARCIGWNQEISKKICKFILSKEKVATYSLPWLYKYFPYSKPSCGEFIIQLDFEGKPCALVQTTELQEIQFKDINSEHSSLDGPPVRDIKVWKNLHTQYWNNLLNTYDMKVAEQMPVIIEKFTCIYPKK